MPTLIFFLLFLSGCAITDATIPTIRGEAHVRVIRPIWTNYAFSYAQKGDETTVSMSTRTEHLDGKQIGMVIGAAIDAALKTQGLQ